LFIVTCFVLEFVVVSVIVIGRGWVCRIVGIDWDVYWYFCYCY